MEQGKNKHNTPNGILLTNGFKKREVEEESTGSRGNSLLLPNLRTSPQLEGPMAWEGAPCRVGDGQSWGLA